MKIRIPVDQYTFVHDYLEMRGYGIVAIRVKKDEMIIIAKRINSLFFMDGTPEITTMAQTSKDNVRCLRR